MRPITSTTALSLLAGLLVCVLGSTSTHAGNGTPPDAGIHTVQFVTCPVYRNTDAGRKSGCWLAENPEDGARYDITRSPTKADWNKAVLVEGVVDAAHADTCGGVVLRPVRVSVLDQSCTRVMLPAEGHPGVAFTLPARNVRPPDEARELPVKPYTERTFGIWFDHDRNFVIYQLSDYFANLASLYALDVDARRVEVTGLAATTPTTISGHRLVESAELARERAEVVANWIRMMGVPGDRVVVKVAARDEPSTLEGSDGLADSSRRRVEVRVIP